MTIVEFLKEKNARVSFDDRWLCWNDALNSWVVYEHVSRGKVKVVYVTDNESKAVAALLADEVE